MKENNSHWVTQSEAAKLKKVSIQVIHNWVRRGHLTTKDLYGKTLVLKKDLFSR